MIKKTCYSVNDEKEHLQAIDLYDENSLLIEHKSFNEKGECDEKSINIYNEEKKVQQIELYDKDDKLIQKMSYTYENDGNNIIQKETIYYLDNSCDVLISTYFKDQLTKIEHYSDNLLVKKEINNYDSENRIIEYKELDEKNNEISKFKCEYSGNSRTITSYMNGELTETIQQEFNENKLIISQINDNGIYKKLTEKEYDARDNLICEKQYDGNLQVYHEIRKYDLKNNCILSEIERLNGPKADRVDIEKSAYEYDINNRLIYSCESGFINRYTYEEI
jgi:hypothetical protein